MAMKYNTSVLILTVNNKKCIEKLSLFLMVIVNANTTIVSTTQTTQSTLEMT